MNEADQNLWTDSRCILLSVDRFGPFIKLADGRILTIEDNATVISADKGETWSEPVVILRMKDRGPSYPHIFEPNPGELWMTTRFRDKTAMCLQESDFV